MKTLLRNFHWALNGERQCMLVENGRVVARDPDPIDAWPSDSPEINTVDLEGRQLLPRFVESHCHILPAGLALQMLSLADARSHEDVKDKLVDWINQRPDGWVMAVQYDQNHYGGVHLTASDLDLISKSRPIFLRHANGHAAVANRVALRLAGVADSAGDPPGGAFGRDDKGHVNGVLLEKAMDVVSAVIPQPTYEHMVESIMRIGEKMSAQGIGCASDMMTGQFNLETELSAYREAIRRGCPIHIRLYVQWSAVFGGHGCGADRLREYGMVDPSSTSTDHSSKIAGVKIFADGAIASGTAAIYGKYCSGHSEKAPISRNARAASSMTDIEVSGQLIYTPERLKEMVRKAHDAGLSVATHSIGDYSTDLVMDAYEATGEPARHRIEHAMLLSDAQIERLARLGTHCAFQPEFLLRLGHAYMRQLGPERAAELLPTRKVIDAGMPLSFSSDRPVVAGDPWDGIQSAVKRPEGFDPSQNCTISEAINAYTAMGSVANGEAGTMGTLGPGSLAEFQILDQLPTPSL